MKQWRFYARFGEEVQLMEARLIPMWFVRRPSEIQAFYAKPKKLPKNAKVEEFRHGITGGPETEAAPSATANGLRQSHSRPTTDGARFRIGSTN